MPLSEQNVQHTIGSLTREFKERHYLAYTLLDNVRMTLRQPDPRYNDLMVILWYAVSLRRRALATLRNLLGRHDVDPRFQSRQHRERIASLYFPFVLLVLDIHEMLSDANRECETCISWPRLIPLSVLESRSAYWRRNTRRVNLLFIRPEELQQTILTDVYSLRRFCQPHGYCFGTMPWNVSFPRTSSRHSSPAWPKKGTKCQVPLYYDGADLMWQ